MTKLQTFREKKGITKYRLAQISGVSQSYIGGLESGRYTTEDMTVKVLKKLAHGLGLKDFTDLLD